MSLVDAFLLEGYRDKAEVWISNRTDGLGSGTEADPFSGATGTGPQIQVSLTNVRTDAGTARVALATTSQALGLVNGDVVTIRNATGEDAKYWNGSFPIYDLSTDGKSFKYWMARKGDDVIQDPAGRRMESGITSARAWRLGMRCLKRGFRFT